MAVRLPTAQNVQTVNPAVTRDIGVEAPAAAFGSAVGQETAVAGDVFADVAHRQLVSREDTIKARQQAAAEETIRGELLRMVSEDDLSDPEILANFGSFVEATNNKILEESGLVRANSQRHLQQSLLDVGSRYSGLLAAQSTKARIERRDKAITDTTAPLIAQAGSTFDPVGLSDLLSQATDRISSFESLGDVQRQTFIQDAHDQIVGNAVQSALLRGGTETADMLLNQFSEVISGPVLVEAQRAVDKAFFAEENLMQELTAAEAALGRSLSSSERTQAVLAHLGVRPGTNIQVQGSVPAPPQGWRNVFDDQGRLVSQEPVPGGPAAMEIEAAQRAGEAKQSQTAKASQLQIEDIDSAIALASTGAGGPIEGSLPEFASAVLAPNTFDLQGQVNAIKGRIGFQTLQEMREASPTGGALGQVAVQELQALQAVLGALDTRNVPRLIQNLHRIREIQLNAWFGTPEELQRAVESGALTAEQVADLQQQRAQFAQPTVEPPKHSRPTAGGDVKDILKQLNAELPNLNMPPAAKELIKGLESENTQAVGEAVRALGLEGFNQLPQALQDEAARILGVEIE